MCLARDLSAWCDKGSSLQCPSQDSASEIEGFESLFEQLLRVPRASTPRSTVDENVSTIFLYLGLLRFERLGAQSTGNDRYVPLALGVDVYNNPLIFRFDAETRSTTTTAHLGVFVDRYSPVPQ